MTHISQFNDVSESSMVIFNKVKLKKRNQYYTMDDNQFLELYAENSLYQNSLNRVVPGNSFLAYDIAMNIKRNGWTMTYKQKRALANVLSHHDALLCSGILKIKAAIKTEEVQPLYNEGFIVEVVQKRLYEVGEVVHMKKGQWFRGMDGTNPSNSHMFNLAKQPLTIKSVVRKHTNHLENRYLVEESEEFVWFGYMIQGVKKFTVPVMPNPNLPMI